MLKRQRWSN